MARTSGLFAISPRMRAVTAVGTALLAAGCMTAQLEESRSLATSIADDEAVVLLAKPHVEGVTATPDEVLLKDRPLQITVVIWGLTVVVALYLL